MSQKLETPVRILSFALASAVLLSLLALSNTLLYAQYYYDYVVFKIMGDGWMGSLVPFRDIFDHKGPFVYVVQMIGSAISAHKTGIWLLEVVFVSITLELLYRCARYMGAPKIMAYLSIIISLIVYACFVDGGNTVEVWSLPFEVLPLLLLLRCLSGDARLKTAAFAGGICFGIVAMIRVNNNAIIAGLVIGMVIILCCRREYSKILNCMGWFLSGMVLAVLPFVIYFLSVGAFDDFIYCTFTFNMRYMTKVSTRTLGGIIYNSIKLFPCVIFLPVLVLYSIKKGAEMLILLAPVGIITYLAYCSGYSYPHYFLMTIPLAALSIQMLYPLGRIVKLAVFALYFIFGMYFLKPMIPGRISYIKEIRAKEAQLPGVEGSRFISDFIPDKEKESIYAYGLLGPAAAIDANGYMPVGKYFFVQDFMQGVDPKVHDDILYQFRKADPKWIIMQSEDMDILEECMSGYVEIPRDSLPLTCPESWRVFSKRK